VAGAVPPPAPAAAPAARQLPTGILRPGIVHRLDKGTTGLMVVAKQDAAHAKLCEQFKQRTVRGGGSACCRRRRGQAGRCWWQAGTLCAPAASWCMVMVNSGMCVPRVRAQVSRTYWSITLGVPQPGGGVQGDGSPGEPRGARITTNIDRDPGNRLRMQALPYGCARGRQAASRWRVLEVLAGGGAALVEWKLETGRTHQIRWGLGDHCWDLGAWLGNRGTSVWGGARVPARQAAALLLLSRPGGCPSVARGPAGCMPSTLATRCCHTLQGACQAHWPPAAATPCRVHAKHIGHPLLGDDLYGATAAAAVNALAGQGGGGASSACLPACSACETLLPSCAHDPPCPHWVAACTTTRRGSHSKLTSG